MESNMFYHSYMAAFEIPSSNNIRRSSLSSCCRVKPCSFDEVFTTSTERISYLLPYSSTEGIHKVIPAETRNVVVKSWRAAGTHDVRHRHPTSEWSDDANTDLRRNFHHEVVLWRIHLYQKTYLVACHHCWGKEMKKTPLTTSKTHPMVQSCTRVHESSFTRVKGKVTIQISRSSVDLGCTLD